MVCCGLFLFTLHLAFSADDIPPSLTLYNQGFAIVREKFPLDLKPGINSLSFNKITAHLEPESVILRDPSGKVSLRILEQNYRNDALSQALLLQRFEGQTLDFEQTRDGKTEIIKGKVIRAPYVMHSEAMRRFGQQYVQQQMAFGGYYNGESNTPIIEVDGKILFALPGQPLFPSLGTDSILQPTLNWMIDAPKGGSGIFELGYVSQGFTWSADYNLIAPEKGDAADLIGWVTMENESGRSFENARIKLMAGDVNKLNDSMAYGMTMAKIADAASTGAPPVSEKAFDNFHLYSVTRPTTLRDRETKQVEFIRAQSIHAPMVYVYDGVFIDPNRYRGWGYDSIRGNSEYGTEMNPKVFIYREIENTEKNGLGIPLPKGRTRFYRQDEDGRLEFVGENEIDHTAKDEKIRIYTGNAFDLVGERIRTNYNMDSNNRWEDESFTIKLRNHKKEAVEIKIVEHLYRWTNWEIKESSDTWLKTNAQTIEFLVKLPPDEEKVVTYKVHYSW